MNCYRLPIRWQESDNGYISIWKVIFVVWILGVLLWPSSAVQAQKQRGVAKERTAPPTKPVGVSSPTQKHALIIGIDGYVFLPKLRACQQDARAMAAFLKSNWGFNPNSITLLTDADMPTKLVLTRRINAFLSTIHKGDEVVFFFAGHGTWAHEKDFIFPIDGSNDDVAGTCYSYTGLRLSLESKSPGRALLVTDACRNIHTGRAAGYKNYFGSSKASERAGFAEFRSCQAGEFARERKDGKGGVFTYFLLEGLSGKAASANKRDITFDSLQNYVASQTTSYVAAQFGQTQTPFGSCSRGVMLLGRVGPPFHAVVDRTKLNDGVVEAFSKSNYEELRKYVLAGATNWDYLGIVNVSPFLELSPGENYITTLHWVAAKDDIKCLQLLIDRGANVNARINGMGFTPLQIAAKFNAQKSAKLPLEKGALPAMESGMYPEFNALHYAAVSNSIPIAEMLIKRGVNPLTAPSKMPSIIYSPIGSAIGQKNFGMVKAMMEEVGSIKSNENADYRSLAFLVIQNDCDDILSLIIGKVKIQDNEYELVHKASKSVRLLGILKNSGINLNSRNISLGNTPLINSVHGDRRNEVENLLQSGADIEARDKYGNTPLEVAVDESLEKLVQFLLEKGANPNPRENTIATPLNTARRNNQDKIVQLLLAFGATE